MQKTKKQNIIFHLFAIFLIIVLCFSISPVSLQNDTFYTIKIGELIVQNGIDMQDHFSWHENLPYTYPHWAYDVIIYGIYNMFGMTGIYISTVLLAFILGVSIYVTNYKISKNKIVSLIVSLIVMYLLKDFVAARAQLVTFILFTLTILFIEQLLKTKKKRYFVFLIIIPLLIANLHVAVWPFYFILFIPYIAEFLICLIIKLHPITYVKIAFFMIKEIFVKEEMKREIQNKIDYLYLETQNKEIESEEKKYKIIIERNNTLKWLSIVIIIAVFTGLCTPLKDTPYTYLLKTMQGNTTQNINEHLPLTLIENKEILAAFTAFLAILILTDTKIKLRDFFMLSGLMLLSFMSRRQTSMFVIIASPIFSNLISSYVSKHDIKIYKILEKLFISYFGKILIITVILLCSVILLKPKLNEKFIDDTTYPVQATNYIAQNLLLDKFKLYNEYNYGSYLIYRGIPVFIDSRADLYAPEFNKLKNEDGDYESRDIFSDFLNISSIATYYENKFEEYGITHILTEKNSKLNLLISKDENYERLYKDDYFVIYKRLSYANKEGE